MRLYLYSGAGNTFVVIDAREAPNEEYDIIGLCTTYHTDGLMTLSEATGYDFLMKYFNSDGSGGMMCGNGGRCIAAFADYLGIKPANHSFYRFLASDGEHEAKILSVFSLTKVVELKMCDVHEFGKSIKGGYYLNTGTRHFVKFVDDVEKIDINTEGSKLRWDKAFAPVGVNVNFVQILDRSNIKVRTFEKGVEGETLACGTGITASAIASYLCGYTDTKVQVLARKDLLEVSFTPEDGYFSNVRLTGPAELLQIIEEPFY